MCQISLFDVLTVYSKPGQDWQTQLDHLVKLGSFYHSTGARYPALGAIISSIFRFPATALTPACDGDAEGSQATAA